VDPAWSEIHGMYGTSMRENREIPRSPRLLITGWAAQGTQGGTPEMHERGKSDRSVVPANPPNKATAAEVGEERERAKGNTDSKTHPGPSAGTDASSALGRVREVARRDKDARFTALLHHVTASRLRRAYWAISPKAAPGVDWVTWDDYGRNLEANLLDLHGRVQSGGYRAKPSRRAYIPKPDGRLRPLGIASLEDKIVQRAVVEVLNAVYEVDFRGFSYGFRPGRGPHDALDALAVGIERKRVNWVLDADIRNFFGQIDHYWLRRFVEHRIADKRIWRLIGKWLAAGVSRMGSGRRVRKVHRRGHRRRRCSRTCTSITCSTCGPTIGGVTTRTEMSSLSVSRTTLSSGFSTRRMRGGSSTSYANGSRGSGWNCTRTRRG
jgi:reverse transcriptase-like protein